MKTPSAFPRSFLSAALLVGMAAIWILFAPAQFGGEASYVIIAGASMEPSLQWGDLVIAHPARSYQIGDVVTYNHPFVGPVIHRIIDRQGTRYVLQGDNNEWIDSYQPTREEILGRSWITLYGATHLLQHLRTPVGLALLSFAIGFMVLLTAQRGEESSRSKPGRMKSISRAASSKTFIQLGEGWTFILAVLLLGGVLLGAYAFSHPLLETIQVDLPYEHQGQFSYQAIGIPSIYDQGRIETGDAIFHSLVSSFETSFNYTFSSSAASDISGTYRLILEVSEPNGWRREINLVHTTEFSGPTFTTSAVVDLERVLQLVDTLKEQTGFSRSDFDVRVIPSVYLQATLNGHELTDRYTPALHFKLDDYQLYLDGVNPFEETTDPLNPQQVGMITHFAQVPNTLDLLGMSLSVTFARWMAGIVTGIALVGLAMLLYPILQQWRLGKSQRINLRHGDQILDVEKMPRLKPTQTVDVTRMEDLVKLSATTGILILHIAKARQHTYMLMLEETVYRFVLQEPEEDPA
jgi:signal peptidase I